MTATGTTGETVDYTQENKYNGFGQRVEKKEGTDVTNYFYDGTAVLYTTDAEGSKTSFNLIGAEDNILSTSRMGADNQADFYVYTKDIRESTTNVLGSDGLAEVSYTYDEYGETTEYQQDEDNPFYNEICYTAGVYDSTTGLYNLNARYYSPSAGTFLTQDTYRGSLSRTSTLNYYAYCAGNPISYTDPSGHHPALAVLGAIVKYGGAALGIISIGSAYKKAKNNNYSKKKTVVAVAVAAVTSVLPTGKIKSAKSVASSVSKFTKNATNITEVSKNTKNVISQPKVSATLKKNARDVLQKATSKKTNQTIFKNEQKRISTVPNRGYNSFEMLKKDLGSPGNGNAWHHIVEQSQIEKTGFKAAEVHNVNNVIFHTGKGQSMQKLVGITIQSNRILAVRLSVNG